MIYRATIFLILSVTVVSAGAVELRISPTLSTTGTFNLSWQGEEGESFRLVQLNGAGEPRLIYQGPDTARVMTGLSNGDYRFQVLGESGESEPQGVTVAHHSLTRALGFFAVGLVVFVATVLLVVRGERGR